MTIGPSSARPETGGANVPKKLLNLLLTCVLACSLVPTAAWAAPDAQQDEAALSSSGEQVQMGALSEPNAPATSSSASDTPSQSEETNPSLALDFNSASNPESATPNSNSAPDFAPASSTSDATNATSSPLVSDGSPLATSLDSDALEIYSATYLNNGETSNNFKVGDTIAVQATQKVPGSYEHPVIPADKLTATWMVSAEKNGTYEPLEGENAHATSFVIPETLEGLYLMCTVNAGANDYMRRTPTNRIAPANAVAVNRVELISSGETSAVAPGDTLTARAFDADGNDVTEHLNVWTWYTNTSTSNYGKTQIDGATASTFTVPADDTSYLGKHLIVNVVDDYGATSFAASAKVAIPGAVELYQVKAEGDTKVGATLSATAYKVGAYNAAVPVEASDKVTYQWQYATRNTTSDTSFKDIPGATEATFDVPERLPDGTSLLGAYLRVKAVSANTAVSTQKPYYGSTLSVDPLGPVSLAGAYELSSVKLTSSGQGMQAGNALTPTARVKQGYYESDAPADAKTTFTWLVSESEGGPFVPVSAGVDAQGVLTLDASLVGKWVKVRANALVNDVESAAYQVLAAGEYDLMRIMATPSSGTLFTGDTVSVKVQARAVEGGSYGDDVTDNVAISWSIGETAEGPFTLLEGASGPSLVIPDEAAGSYLKATATSANTVVWTGETAVADSNSLAAAAQKLEAVSFTPTPVQGEQDNVNELVEAKLAELGYDDVTVTVKSVATNTNSEPKAEVGVSSAPDATNGDVMFFFLDPAEKASYLGYLSLRRVELTFELSRNGETFDTAGVYEPAIIVSWDEGRVEELLEQKAASLAVGFSLGDSADAVTGNLVLPYKLAGAPWSEVTWESSDTSVVRVNGYGWSDYTGAVTRTVADRAVVLTATLGVITSGGPETTVSKSYELVVKGDPQKVEAEKAALAQKVEAGFTYNAVRDALTNDTVDPTALAGDVRLPNPSALGVDGKYYQVTYAASSDTMEVNGYAGRVFQPLPGSSSDTVEVSVTVTDKTNPAVTATKTLSFTVAPLEQTDLNRELMLMDAAKAGYAAALAQSQDPNAVEGNLHAFQKATLGADGSLVWSYDRAAADAAGNGIVPVDLEGYDPMGSGGWRLFKSSNPAVIAHENLLVTSPVYHTNVTVESRLSSEKYARYAERYPQVSAFQQLANQNVAATFTVQGTSGQEDPHVTATCSVLGVDAEGNPQTWAAAEPYTLDAGATVADLSEVLFARAGIEADFGMGEWGWALNSVTSPFDANLSLSLGTFPNKGWFFYVNGKDLGKSADQVVLQPGDRVIWRYGAWDDPAPSDKLSVTCSVVGVDASGARQTWAAPATFEMDEGTTAADLSEALFAQAGIAYTALGTGASWYLNDLTSPDDGRVVGYDEATGRYWQFFINGEYSLTTGAGGYSLQAGDEVTWLYAADGETLPDPDEVIPNPSAPRPNYDASWPGFAGGAVEERPTPSESAELAWSYSYAEGASGKVGVSEPLVVNGDVYLVAGSELRRVDSATGEVLARANIGDTISYCCRPVYADGVVVVPTDDGRLAAFTADKLVCTWRTPALSTDGFNNSYQALSSLTVSGGRVYAAFTMVGAGGVGAVGTLVCVSLADGTVVWTRTDAGNATSNPAGYYWAGAAASGNEVIIGGESGEVRLLDGAAGKVLSSVALGAPCRAGIVAAGDGAFLAVTTDGRLHRLVRSGDTLSRTGSVAFAASSKSTPAVAGNTAFICGVDADGFGTLTVVDLATLTVERTVRGTLGEALSSPLVSVQADGTYAYFTCNGKPGGVFGYRLGDEAAYALFVPTEAQQDYCMASVAADQFGNLYYTNDSGTLFKLAGKSGAMVSFEAAGGSYVAPRYVAVGTPVARPADPTRKGFTFDGWYADEACTVAWNFDAPVTGPTTLYAKWIAPLAPGADDNSTERPNTLPALPAGRTPLGGSIAATHAPLTQEAKAEAKKQEQAAKAASSKATTGSNANESGRALATGADTGAAENESVAALSAVNPWAVAGIALGVAGLVVAALVALRGRRKEGAQS